MRIVKLLMMAMGVIGAILCFVYKLPSYGDHGLIVIVACLVPVVLGALGTLVLDGIPRWASAISAIAFLIAAMKTHEGRDLQNIMMAAAAGLLLAVALLIKPDRSPATR